MHSHPLRAVRRSVLIVGFVIVANLTHPALAGPLPPRYEVTYLRLPGETRHISWVDINDSGTVALSVVSRDVRFDSDWETTVLVGRPDGEFQTLGRYGNLGASVAINNAEQVVIGTYGANPWGAIEAGAGSYVWDGGAPGPGALQPIDMGASTEAFVAWDINDAGDVVGSLVTGEGYEGQSSWTGPMQRPLLLAGDGRLVELDAPAHRPALAWQINNRGDIVAVVGTGEEGMERPWHYVPLFGLWSLGDPLDIGAALEYLPDTYLVVQSINDRGQLLVRVPSPDQSDATYAVVDSDGRLRPLIIPGQWPIGLDLNAAGTVIGATLIDDIFASFVSDPTWGTSLFTELLVPAQDGSGRRDLWAINNAGQIVGSGTFDGQLGLFIATPIPEPVAALYLLLAGPWLLRRV